QQAKADARLHHTALPSSKEELEAFYNKVKGAKSMPLTPVAPSKLAVGAPVAPTTGIPSTGAAEVPPVEPPVPPVKPIDAIPPSGKPRTIADMAREAKGMRALTPIQRAAVMDDLKPIAEGDLLYSVKSFNEHADNLLGPDTPIASWLRSVPGAKQITGLVNKAQMTRDNPVALIGLRKGIFQEVERARASFAADRWWNDAQEVFNFRKAQGVWRAGKVVGNPTLDDLLEHAGRYKVTPQQERALKLGQDMQTQILRDAQRVGVDAVEMGENYWHRIVLSGPEERKAGSAIRNHISSRKGYTYGRAFKTVDEATDLGYKYETNPLLRLKARLHAGIDTIANQEARNAIARLPGVEKPLERLERRFPEILERVKQTRTVRDAAKSAYKSSQNPEAFESLRQAEADFIQAMRDLYAAKREVALPNLYEMRLPNGRIAPASLVEDVSKFIELPEMPRATEASARLINDISQMVRTTLTNVDMAAGYIQGQALFYRNNIAWWKSQAVSIVSLIDDPYAWVAKNFDIIDEVVRVGAISRPVEFLFAEQGLASIPTKIPVIGSVLKVTNRAFGWFITAGQTELYKVAKQTGMGMDDLVSLGSAIRKELGTESYTIMGIRPTQQTFEALSLFAARFFRANVGLMGQVFTGGPGGAEARRAIGALLAGGTTVTLAINWAQDKKLPNLTDPFAPDWMSFRIGKTYFNTFGPFYTYFRTIARMSVSIAEGNPSKAASEEVRFLRSKGSLPFRAVDIAGQFAYYGSARTFEGALIKPTPGGIAAGILSEFITPIGPEEVVKGIAEGRPESALGMIGLTGRASPYAQMFMNYRQKYGRSFPSQELRKLDISIGSAPRKVGEVELSESQRREYILRLGDTLGPLLEKTIASPAYRRLTDEQKTESLKALISYVKAQNRPLAPKTTQTTGQPKTGGLTEEDKAAFRKAIR
ncbi:MAG: hypothetical protein U1C52_01065, partial [Patescibacteria group bacterium]|nr:hypothetical protein [Patescibacteria group bacterium]